MIICRDCLEAIAELGNVPLQLLLDVLIYFEEDILLAYDTRHVRWRTFEGELRPSKDVHQALTILEKKGFLVSTEIHLHLIGISVNWFIADYDDENDTICWCSREFLE